MARTDGGSEGFERDGGNGIECNIADRGLLFDFPEEFDWNTVLITEDARKTYAERRYHALGLITDRLYMLVFTPRDGAVHVIGLCRANHLERSRYAATTRPRIDRR